MISYRYALTVRYGQNASEDSIHVVVQARTVYTAARSDLWRRIETRVLLYSSSSFYSINSAEAFYLEYVKSKTNIHNKRAR